MRGRCNRRQRDFPPTQSLRLFPSSSSATAFRINGSRSRSPPQVLPVRVEGGQVSIKYSNDDTNPTVHYTRLMDASKYDSVALVNAKILSDCSKASKHFAGTTPPSSIPPYKTRFHNSSIAVEPRDPPSGGLSRRGCAISLLHLES